MGLEITPQYKIDDYFESTRVSQSTLKSLLGGLDNFLAYQNKEESAVYYEEKTHFILGSAIDMKLTGEEEAFGNAYHVAKDLEDKPSDTEMSIIQQVVDELRSEGVLKQMDTLRDCWDMIKIACVDQQYYKGNPGEKRLNNLVEKGEAYFQDVKLAEGKQVLSSLEHQTVLAVCDSLKNHEIASDIFDREELKLKEDVKVIYQKIVYFEYMGIPCKALLDIVVEFYNEEGQLIKVWPIDLKTKMGSTLKFDESVRSWRYDIQSAWYTLALKFAYPMNTAIQNFSFLVESSTRPGTPLLFHTDQDFLHHGRYGAPEEVLGSGRLTLKEIKGFEQLMEDYKFYEEIDFAYDKRLQNKDNTFNLNFNSIT